MSERPEPADAAARRLGAPRGRAPARFVPRLPLPVSLSRVRALSVRALWVRALWVRALWVRALWVRALWVRALPLCIVLLGASCADDDAGGAGPELGAGGEAAGEAEALRPPQQIFDANGDLLASELVVAGLALPMGAEPAEDEGSRRHLFRIRAPLGKVQAYFGTRLVTADVRRYGDSAVYREAVPQGVRGGAVRMDVALVPERGGLVAIRITELPPPPAKVPTEAQIREQLAHDRAKLD